MMKLMIRTYSSYICLDIETLQTWRCIRQEEGERPDTFDCDSESDSVGWHCLASLWYAASYGRTGPRGNSASSVAGTYYPSSQNGVQHAQQHCHAGFATVTG